MKVFNIDDLRDTYRPLSESHKGQNGKLLIVGGSHLFHAASLWAFTIASRIVDMVFYSSVAENNELVAAGKREFRNGIIVSRDDLDRYVEEANVVLIGPGMVRSEGLKVDSEKLQIKYKSLREINALADEGEQSYYLTQYLLEKYPKKKWVIDAGALQMMELAWLAQLKEHVLLTPHQGEFERLKSKIKDERLRMQLENQKLEDEVALFAKAYNCTVLLKGHEDVVCPPAGRTGPPAGRTGPPAGRTGPPAGRTGPPAGRAGSTSGCVVVRGGNAGMTKGGTGDVLAGLAGALACNNDLWTAAKLASYFNKRAGDSLLEKVGYYFNASDLADEIPRVMRECLVA